MSPSNKPLDPPVGAAAGQRQRWADTLREIGLIDGGCE